MELEIENDKEIERLGSKAAVEYMKWHEKELECMALSGRSSIVFQDTETADKRLYLTLRSNISHPMDFVGGTILKTRRWGEFLLCTQDRIPDFNFITLLRPDATKSYDDQRDELLVVPRSQFIFVEIARCHEGCYGTDWRSTERMRLSRTKLRLFPTTRFHVLDITLATKGHSRRSEDDQKTLFQHEVQRVVAANSINTEIARRGEQLNDCLSAQEAADHHILEDDVLKRRLGDALAGLEHGKRFVVVDNVISDQVARTLERKCLKHFTKLGDTRIHAQSMHRGDDVFFLPLFDSDVAEEAQVLLSNIANLSSEQGKLLMPRLGQLALYDGVGRGPKATPGYVAHLDNCVTVGGEGENHRELTAILYLNEAPEGCSGGSLRCYSGFDEASAFDRVDPKIGRLVIFPSRKLLHEVTPVVGWKRLALSVWILKDSRGL